LGLTWADVDMTRDTLILRRSKVQDALTFELKGPLKDALGGAWSEAGMPVQGLVFPSRDGKPLTRTGVLTVFKREVTALGWPWLCLRTFRKVAATAVVEATGDIRKAQHLLGHSSQRTTEAYLGRGEQARAEASGVMARYLDEALGRNPGTIPGMVPISGSTEGKPKSAKVETR